AQPDIAHGIVTGTAFFRDQSGVFLAKPLDLAQAKTHGVRCPDIVPHLAMKVMQTFGRVRARLERRIPVRVIDVGWAYLDAVFAHVTHDLCRRVEAHRLSVQEGCAKGVRIAAFQPGRGIDQQGKARGVTFGKTVFAEALDLLEATLGEVTLVAVGQHTVDHFALERTDGADALEGR